LHCNDRILSSSCPFDHRSSSMAGAVRCLYQHWLNVAHCGEAEARLLKDGGPGGRTTVDYLDAVRRRLLLWSSLGGISARGRRSGAGKRATRQCFSLPNRLFRFVPLVPPDMMRYPLASGGNGNDISLSLFGDGSGGEEDDDFEIDLDRDRDDDANARITTTSAAAAQSWTLTPRWSSSPATPSR